MTISNIKSGEKLIDGKRYWRFSIGRNAVPSRYFNDGWQACELIVSKPYHSTEEGAAHPYSIKIAFAFWLPFFFL